MPKSRENNLVRVETKDRTLPENPSTSGGMDIQVIPISARAVLLGDRLVVNRAEQREVISTAPFAYRKHDGYVVIFRYGVIVLVGLQLAEEKKVLDQTSREQPLEEERIEIELGGDEGLAGNGRLQIKGLSPAHVLVLADILAKSVALARYEREIASVFDTIEPAANMLAIGGRLPKDRRALLQLVGSALLAQHRVSGRIAFAEKPEVLWEHPELERFYAKLEDEYEIVERGTLLNGKMSVLSSAAQTFTDMMDTARSARLELLIVILIVAELVIGAATLFRP
jgi:required for meiotic nuclear division protein 1